eukprot:CAMPEP_0118921862 /NCGR_PEP_ID=MMETSP1169-20130426/1007_1 /TAXON_ID=36882 /ORGANISM="Pyramimonas obovata, Strain CCMP722" /LENGTH=380 /DNA_ID=CAMNT_0006862653 /DNA_START=169 /DNA_END=1311 /DNA_ORIENTATION=+
MSKSVVDTAVHRVGVTDTRTKDGLSVRLFYPSRAPPANWASRPRWAPHQQYVYGYLHYAMNLAEKPVLSKVLQYSLWPLVSLFKCEASWELPVAEGEFPVVVWSHGLAGMRTTYSGLLTRLVESSNVIVAAVEHADGSACNCQHLKQDGKLEWPPYKHTDGNIGWRQEQLAKRVGDMSNALSLLERLNSGKEQLSLGVDFAGKIQLSDATSAGHSFGAATAIVAGDRDPRFTRTLAFDPWLFALADEPSALDFTRTPMCVLNSEKWNPTWRTPIPGRNNMRMDTMFKARQAKRVPTLYAELAGTKHMSASDVPYLMERLMIRSAPAKLAARDVLDVFASLASAFITEGDFAQTIDELDDLVTQQESFKEFEEEPVATLNA